MRKNQTQKYSQETIIRALENNRDAHVEEYIKAYSNYKKELKRRLEKALEKLVAGGLPDIPLNMGLPKPVLRSDEYEKRINIIRMVVDKEIELTFTEADVIFNDNWNFFDLASKMINSTYASSAEIDFSSDDFY